jgi:hypothetical protein
MNYPIVIDGERYHVTDVHDCGYLVLVDTAEGPDFYVAKDSGHTGDGRTVCQDLEDEIGFQLTVAYRHN